MPRPTKISQSARNRRAYVKAKLFDMTRPGSRYAPGTHGRAPLATRGFGSMAIKSNRERKFFDIDTATYQVNTTGSFTLLHIPQVGADFTNRVGRKTVAKSVYIRGRVMYEALNNNFATVTVASAQARMIIFVDSQPNGASPAVTDLLKEALPTSQLNPNNRDRFRVIKDKTYVFDGFLSVTTVTQAQAAINRTIHDIKCYKKLNLETIYSTSTGNIADINTGALYMFWISNLAAGANTDIDAIASTRVRFDDS